MYLVIEINDGLGSFVYGLVSRCKCFTSPKYIVGNDDVTFKLNGEVTESPASKLRPDVLSAIQSSLTARGFDAPIVPYLESGGTDGMHYRTLGYDTVAISGAASRSEDMYAHGLNERLAVDEFYAGLDHWSIILKELATDK